MKLTWYEGAKDGKRNLPPSNIFPDRGLAPSDSGSVIVGSLYRMYSPNDYGAKQVVWPKGDYVELKGPDLRTLPRHERPGDSDTNQKREWVAAIRAGKPALALSNFDYSATLTESMLLGNIAVRSGKVIDDKKKPEESVGSIEYNPEKGEFANNSEASQYLRPYIRKGWEI